MYLICVIVSTFLGRDHALCMHDLDHSQIVKFCLQDLMTCQHILNLLCLVVP